MSDVIVINDKSYHAIRVAADAVLYSPDYITRLARGHKISAVQLGRRWYIQLDSLRAYVEVQAQEHEVRKKHLRQLRKQELHQRNVTAASPCGRKVGEYHMLATMLGLVALGLTGGSQLLNASFTNTAALVANTTDGVGVTRSDRDTSGQAEMIQPVFTEVSNDRVFVTSDRTAEHPFTELNGWRYIEHE